MVAVKAGALSSKGNTRYDLVIVSGPIVKHIKTQNYEESKGKFYSQRCSFSH